MTRKPRSHVRIFYISNVGYFLLPPRLVSPRARQIFTHARLYRSRNYSWGKLHKQEQVVDFWTKGAFMYLINLCLHRISLLLSLKWVVQQQILKFYMFKISELQPGVCHHFHKFPNWQQTFKKLLYLSHGKKNYFTQYYTSYKYYVMIIFRKLLPFLIA